MSGGEGGGRVGVNIVRINDMVHNYLVYTERAEMAAVLCGTSHASAVSTPLR